MVFICVTLILSSYALIFAGELCHDFVTYSTLDYLFVFRFRSYGVGL